VEWLETIPGRVPGIDEDIVGCAFNARCSRAEGLCWKVEPDAHAIGPEHVARCHFAEEVAA
jgi:oligopeptide/dipeptide ABC transporter ATP-binding protein